MIKRAIASSIFSLLLAQYSYALPISYVPEGGIRVTRSDRSNIGHRSRSQSGSSANGFAGTRSGGIRVGGSSSTVDSFLNELFVSESDQFLNVASDKSVLGMAFELQQPSPHTDNLTINTARSKARGDLSPNVIDILSSSPSLVDIIVLDDPNYPDRPVKKVQLSQAFEDITAEFLRLQPSGEPLSHGAHVVSLQSTSSASPLKNFRIKRTDPVKDGNSLFKIFDGSGRQAVVSPVYKGYSNILKSASISSRQTSNNAASSKSLQKLTVVGFNTSLDPLSNRTATISTSAVSGKSFGKTSPLSGDATLEKLASQYGTTVQALIQLNNITANTPLLGLILDVPADLSTISFACTDDGCADGVRQGQTLREIADAQGINVKWLMELNGLTDPNLIFEDLTKLQIPGLKEKSGQILPEALPTNTTLESADFGAYTQFEETYQVEASPQPLFQNTFRRSF